MTNIILHRIQRLMYLVMLVKTSRQVSLPDLIADLGISRSQYYRDKQDLNDIGLSYNYDRRKKCFALEKDCFLPVEKLGLDELLALVLSVHQLTCKSDFLLFQKASQGIQKLATGLTPNLSKLCANLFEWDLPGYNTEYQNKILNLLQAALEENRRIIIRYKKHHQPLADYQVDPYYLYVKNGFLYMDAMVLGVRKIKTFRVIRIQHVEPTGICFSPCQYNFQELHRHDFNVFSSHGSETVVVYFSPTARPYIEEVRWHGSQNITVQPDNGIHFQVEIAEPREVLWWAMSWGHHAEILKPDWLRREAGKTAKKMLGNYE
jgi:predicted DNA-binding transcriptional regulator YafY